MGEAADHRLVGRIVAALVLVALGVAVVATVVGPARPADEPVVVGRSAGGPSGGGARPGEVPPFDPAEPLDLTGIRGVTQAQAVAAGELVGQVGDASVAFGSPEAADAAGYRSLGDAFTGEEHWIDWAAVVDGEDLDPTRPEALVFEAEGDRRLLAVMFLRPPGTRTEDAPAPGGALTRWHRLRDLCLDETGPEPFVAGWSDAAGRCAGGLAALRPLPALHVWVVANPCGPFASLAGVGVGADALRSGCQHDHGS